MKYRLIDYTTMIIIYITILIAGIFIGVVLDRTYHHNTFNHELTIRVQPRGTAHYPYPPWHHYNTTLDYQDFKVIIKNGNITHTEWLQYSFQEK